MQQANAGPSGYFSAYPKTNQKFIDPLHLKQGQFLGSIIEAAGHEQVWMDFERRMPVTGSGAGRIIMVLIGALSIEGLLKMRKVLDILRVSRPTIQRTMVAFNMRLVDGVVGGGWHDAEC
jgi:hypothetical protein